MAAPDWSTRCGLVSYMYMYICSSMTVRVCTVHVKEECAVFTMCMYTCACTYTSMFVSAWYAWSWMLCFLFMCTLQCATQQCAVWICTFVAVSVSVSWSNLYTIFQVLPPPPPPPSHTHTGSSSSREMRRLLP